MIKSRLLIWVMSCMTAALCLMAPAHAQTLKYPSKPVRVLVPFAPGQGSDTLARVVGERLSALWGQPVLVENRSGANGSLAAQEVARSPADGHTLLLTSNSPVVINPNIYRKLGYNVARDLKAVTLLATTDLALAVTPALPAKNANELIAYLRANPGKLSYGSPGVGSTSHLSMEAFKQAAGVDLVHVPYKGSSPAMTDLMGGNIQLMMDALPSTLQNMKAGRIRVLAVLGSRPSSFAPEIPTLASTGITGLPAGGWYGVFTPAGVDAAIVTKLFEDLKQVMAQPEVEARLRSLYLEPVTPITPARFNEFIQQETAGWEKTTRALGLYQTE